MSQPRAIRKMAVILAADVVGYSRLVGRDEEGTLARLRDTMRRVVRPKLATHRGRMVKTTGDGALIEFSSVVDALRAAIEIQQDNARANRDLPEDRRLVFRMGINLGDVVVDGTDLLGDGVNVAARIETLCRPGGVFLSRAARDQALGKLPVEFVDEGEHQVKNIERPVHVFSLAFDAYVADPVAAPAGGWRWPVALGAVAASVFVLFVGLAWWRPWQSRPTPPTPPAAAAVQVQPVNERPTIAVLPFTNLSGDPQQDYFSDGISEDLLTALTRFSRLRVIGRNSSFQYKGRSVDLRKIGEELGAQFVLEGSVRRDGDNVRIAAQLIEAANGTHLWAEKFDKPFKDVFAISDEVVSHVASAMLVQILASETERVRRMSGEHADGYELTLRGRALRIRGDRESVLEARRQFERAIAIDANYAPAHAELSRSLSLINNNRWNEEYASPATVAKVLASGTRAFELDPQDAYVLAQYASALSVAGQHDEAAAMADRAIATNPNDPEILFIAGAPLMRSGAPERAIAVIEAAIHLDPNYGVPVETSLGMAYFFIGNYAATIAAARRCIGRAPSNTNCHANLIAGLWELGQRDEARAAAAALLRVSPDFNVSGETNRRRKSFRDRAGTERYLTALRAAGVPEN